MRQIPRANHLSFPSLSLSLSLRRAYKRRVSGNSSGSNNRSIFDSSQTSCKQRLTSALFPFCGMRAAAAEDRFCRQVPQDSFAGRRTHTYRVRVRRQAQAAFPLAHTHSLPESLLDSDPSFSSSLTASLCSVKLRLLSLFSLLQTKVSIIEVRSHKWISFLFLDHLIPDSLFKSCWANC